MKGFESLTFTRQIIWRIRGAWCLVIMLLIYMVAVAEMGGGDSRVMTRFADMAGDLIFFGSLIYLIARIVHNKKLLKNRMLLKEQMQMEQDERNQYLHDKSGGIVMDLLLVCLLFSTMTAALFNMPAFYLSFALLVTAVALKSGAYLFFSRHT